MFIERDDHRWWRFALSGGFFIALMLLIMFNSSVLTMIDAVLQSLFTSQRLEGIGWFHALMSLLSMGIYYCRCFMVEGLSHLGFMVIRNDFWW